MEARSYYFLDAIVSSDNLLGKTAIYHELRLALIEGWRMQRAQTLYYGKGHKYSHFATGNAM